MRNLPLPSCRIKRRDGIAGSQNALSPVEPDSSIKHCRLRIIRMTSKPVIVANANGIRTFPERKKKRLFSLKVQYKQRVITRAFFLQTVRKLAFSQKMGSLRVAFRDRLPSGRS
jgi:hypothetical protein